MTPPFFDLLRTQCDTDAVARYVAADHRLADAISSSVSVDDALYFLSDYPDAIVLGKICIVRSILKAERDSALALSRETGQIPPDAKDGWIEQMFSMAISNYKISELQKAFDKVTFVNFNYDRCLEHYLFWSLQRVGVPTGDAAKGHVRSLDVHFPWLWIPSPKPKFAVRFTRGPSSF